MPVPAASRRTTRILVIAAVALAVALGVLVTLPGRGTPTVVARATPSGASSSAVTPASPTGGLAGPTGSPSSSPAWSPSGPSPTRSVAGPTTSVSGPTTSVSGPTSTSEPTGPPTSRPPTRRPTSAPATRPPTGAPRTSAPTTRTPPTTISAAVRSPLPGFGFGEHVTLLDPAVLDRRVANVGGAAVMQVIPLSAPTSVLQSASWVVRPGLADKGCVSFESVSAPGSYLVSSAGRLRVALRSGGSFDGAATLCVRSPALDGTWGVSLNSWQQRASSVTRRLDGLLGVLPSGTSPRSQTFRLWVAPA